MENFEYLNSMLAKIKKIRNEKNSIDIIQSSSAVLQTTMVPLKSTGNVGYKEKLEKIVKLTLDKTAYKTIVNISLFVINNKCGKGLNKKSKYDVAKKIFDYIGFQARFGNCVKGFTWEKYCSDVYNKIYHDKKYIAITYLPKIISAIELVIPKEEKIIPNKRNQTIKSIELALFLKRILNKIILNTKNTNNPWAILARNYWKTNFSKEFKKQTGRVINNHKIAKIISLLHKYEFIICEYRLEDGKHKANLYRIGENSKTYMLV